MALVAVAGQNRLDLAEVIDRVRVDGGNGPEPDGQGRECGSRGAQRSILVAAASGPPRSRKAGMRCPWGLNVIVPERVADRQIFCDRASVGVQQRSETGLSAAYFSRRACSALASRAAVCVLNTSSFSSQARRATLTPYSTSATSAVLCASGLMTSLIPSALARLQWIQSRSSRCGWALISTCTPNFAAAWSTASISTL